MKIYSQDSNIIGILLNNKNDNDLIPNLRQIRHGLREVRKLYTELLEENRSGEVYDVLEILLENKAVDWIAYTIYDSGNNRVLQEWRYEFQNNPYYSIEISSDILQTQTDIPFKLLPNVPSKANFICHISWASCLSQEQKNIIINKISTLNLASIEKSAYPNSICLYTQKYFQSSYSVCSIKQNNSVNPNTPSPKISFKHTALLDVELKGSVKKYTVSSSNHKTEIGDVRNINKQDIQLLFKDFQSDTGQFIQTNSSLTSNNDENYKSILIDLKRVGSKFYDLFPSEFHKYFSDLDEGTIISIQQAEELKWIPWEIIYDADEKIFWGQKFIITRLRDQVRSKKEKISNRIEFFNRRLHFLSNSISENEEKNEEYIERARNMINNNIAYHCLTNLSRVELTDELEKLSESAIIHFTCHGSMDGKNRPTLVLSGDSNNPDDSLDIEMIKILKLNNIPFIFANACMTETSYKDCWSESVNFGFTFLDRGVQAFIGTMGSIPVEPALEFAEIFYRNLRTLSVGEALWETKKIFSNRNNLFWLFYCLYGDATLYFREQQLDETQISSSSM